MNDLGWYVIQAQARKERMVRDRVHDLGREVFLPMLSERVPGSRRRRVGPMFPGYLFARLSREDGDFPRVRWTHGVRRLLGVAGDPRALPDEVVTGLRARSDREGRVALGRRLVPGSRVRIVDGPLTGMIGVLQNPASTAEDRVAVLLDLFNRPTRVEVPAEAVWA